MKIWLQSNQSHSAIPRNLILWIKGFQILVKEICFPLLFNYVYGFVLKNFYYLNQIVTLHQISDPNCKFKCRDVKKCIEKSIKIQKQENRIHLRVQSKLEINKGCEGGT